MVDAVAGLIDAGRVKLYCVDTVDGQTWHDGSLPLEERARRHGAYEEWILGSVVPFIADDCGGAQEIAVTGPSFGAYPRRQLRAQARRPVPARRSARAASTTSPPSAGASAATPSTSTTPPTTCRHLHGDHLDWLRGRLNMLIICGQGQWEDTTGALESSKRFAGTAGGEGPLDTSSTSGATTSRTTGRPGAPQLRASPAALLLSATPRRARRRASGRAGSGS